MIDLFVALGFIGAVCKVVEKPTVKGAVLLLISLLVKE